MHSTFQKYYFISVGGLARLIMEQNSTFKHLYRSRNNRVFAGIFGGFGVYWNIDPVVLRILWVLVTIFTGFFPGIIAYIVGIFVIPEQPLTESSETVNESATAI